MNAPNPNDYRDSIDFIEALGTHFRSAPKLDNDALDDLAKSPPSEIIETFNNILDKMIEAGQDLMAAAADLRKRLAPPTVDTAHGFEVGQYVKRIGKIIRIDDVTPTPPPKVLEFVFEERHARIELRRKDKVLQDMGTYSDFYGEGTGEQEAIEHAAETAQEMEITKDSEVEMVVVRLVSQCRYKHLRRVRFSHEPPFDRLDVGCARDLADDVVTDVWSSRSGSLIP